MASISPIRLVPDLTDQVYQRLLNAICDGDLAPGARLTQEDLAATLHVSRQPVLQALRMLKKDGFVIDTGRRGLMVLPLGAQTLSHIYEVRSALDGLAARQAALSKSRIDLGVIAEGRKAIKGSRIGAMIDADMRFHNLIYSASRNPLIAQSASHHWRHIRRAMGVVLQQAGVRDTVWDEHEAILKAINRGDADRAERLARRHGEEAGQHLVQELGRHVREAS
ncbi:MAG: GntR family transcriptional regulator [Betaproteobacteria bacterium]|nr:GntR family transcriptional regulator [Betaproteobacteria bacterium]